MKNFVLRKDGELVGEGVEFTSGRVAIFWSSTRSIQEYMSLDMFSKIHACCDQGLKIEWSCWPEVDTYRVFLVGKWTAHLVAQDEHWFMAETPCGIRPGPGARWFGIDCEAHVRQAQNMPLCLMCSNSTLIS